MSARILLVEDDPTIGAALERALGAHGYGVTWVKDAAAARAEATAAADAVLLDLGLPDADGVDLCRELVDAEPTRPVIILTARREEVDVVVGLGAGAVDYVAKPFRLAELLARLEAHLRFAARPQVEERLVAGDITVDTGSRRIWVGGEEIQLRTREFDLLTRLARDAGRVVTRETLMTEVWDEHWFGPTKTLDVHIAALRRRFGEATGEPSRITTIRGVGYRLEAP